MNPRKKSNELIAIYKIEKAKRKAKLIIANKELNFQNREKEKRAAELIIANKELSYQTKEKEKRASELIIANRELLFQNEEKEKRAAELIRADKELAFQSEEKEKRARELIIANKELAFQTEEKEKRANELIIANKELAFQNEEKEKRAKELLLADKELVVVNKELEKTEEELKVTLERLLFHLGNTPLGFIEWDEEGHLKYKSHKAEEIFGWTLKELLAGKRSAYDQVYAEDLPLVNKIVKQLIHGEVETNKVRHRNITKDGRVIWCEWFNSVLKDKDGKVVSIMSLVQDITEQKKLEESLWLSENRFRVLIEKSMDMKTLSTSDGEMIYCSPSITKVLGYSLEEFVHQSAFDLIHPDDIPGFKEKRNEILQTPGKSFVNQNRFLHKNGDWIWCEGTVTNMLNEPGINAMVSNFRDITGKKAGETEKEFDSYNLNALINNTNDLMWSVDKNFSLITSNKPFDEMGKVNFGRTIAKGDNVLSASNSPEMLTHFKKLYERAFAGEAFTEIEYFDSPVEVWTEISYYPIRRGDEIIGTACHSRDITELKKGEKNLFESEARLKEAQALAHISNWEINLLTGVNTWSDEFYNIMGTSREEVQPSPEAFLSFIHPDESKHVGQMIEKSFETFENSFFHSRAKTKDGSTKHIYSEYRFEFDNTKTPIRLYGILQDVTEQKNAEEKIKQSENRFREFFDSAPETIVIFDITTFKFSKFNDNAVRLFKYSAEELLKKGPADISPEFQPDGSPSEEKAKEFTLSAIKGDKPVFEWMFLDANGKEILCEIRLATLSNVGSPQLLGSFIDITERKNAELKIKESELKYRSLIEQASDTIIVIDNKDSILEINSRGEKLFGYTRDELLKMTLKELLFEEDTGTHLDEVANGQTVVYERRIKRKDETSVDVEVSARMISDGRIFGIFRDISDRKIAQEERDRLTANIILRNKDLEQFTYIVSHNLRAPVANILGAANRLSDQGLSTEKKDVLAAGIKESVVILDNVIKDLNHILQVKNDIAEIKEKVRFSELVEEIEISINNLIDRGNIEIKYDFSAIDEFLTLKSYLYSIFYNLISNSIKFRQEQVHSLITIKSHRLKGKVELIFADNGMGIDLKKRGEQVFGLYKRFHTNIEGKGMGLFMVKTQVETLGGKISIRSEVNKGTEFKIEFEI